MTYPKGAIVRDGDLWSSYKRAMVQTKEGRFEEQGEKDRFYDSKADLDEEGRASSRSQVAPHERTCAALR
jgi:hypothetical protein